MEKFIFSGFGGQGVLTLGQTFALIGLEKGFEVTWMPSYGAEMRGGTANCSVIISDDIIGSPLVTSDLDYLFAMNNPSVDKFIGMVKPGGTVIVNSSIVTKEVERTDVKVIKVDATNIAINLGSAKVANMVMIAGYLHSTDKFNLADVETVLQNKFGKKNPKLVPMNMQAIEKGLAEIK